MKTPLGIVAVSMVAVGHLQGRGLDVAAQVDFFL